MTLAGIICLIIISPLVLICGFISLLIITSIIYCIIYCIGDLIYKCVKVINDYVSNLIAGTDYKE